MRRVLLLLLLGRLPNGAERVRSKHGSQIRGQLLLQIAPILQAAAAAGTHAAAAQAQPTKRAAAAMRQAAKRPQQRAGAEIQAAAAAGPSAAEARQRLLKVRLESGEAGQIQGAAGGCARQAAQVEI